LKFKASIFLFCLTTILVGCTTYNDKYSYYDGKYVNNYENRAPTRFEPTDICYVFEYENVDLQSLYQTLFSEYYIIGTSSFEGGYENIEMIKGYGRKIGADIIIGSIQYTKTETTF